MKILFWIAVSSGPVAILLLGLGAWSPAVVEHVYSRGLYAAVSPWISRFFALIPFPVAPVLLVLGLGAAVGSFFLHPKAWMGVLAALSVILAWFVFGWGLNYQRQSWAENVGWPVKGGTVADLKNLAKRLAERTGPLREEAGNTDRPTGTGLLKNGIPKAYEKASVRWPLLAGRFAGPKAAPGGRTSFVDGDLGDLSAVHRGTFSQRGARGMEPSFHGGPRERPTSTAGPGKTRRTSWPFWFWKTAGIRGWSTRRGQWLLLYVAGALQEQGAEGVSAWKSSAAALPAAVLDDWKAYYRYWDRFAGPVQKATQAVNDTYLKAQGQRDGVKSYGRMVDLLLAWETSL